MGLVNQTEPFLIGPIGPGTKNPTMSGEANRRRQEKREYQSLGKEIATFENGGSRFIEEDDRNARRDGCSKSAARLQRPVRASPDSAQQMSPGRVFPPVEVRGRAPRVREVRVRARHGEDARDAEDPRGRSQG